MSAAPESSLELVAVACVVESSILLASEWSRILSDYVHPLFKRLNELHPSHQLRLALVTYGAADTRPIPLLSKRFFAPLSQVTRALREEPSKLGIGQTNSGGTRGLSALEGFVAAIELFDILMSSGNFVTSLAQTQSPQKETRSLISHLLHIAASPRDGAQRPHCNMLQHLDSVNWDSIPAELKKRKINLSLISLRKLPEFQNLQSLVAGPGTQPPWFNVRVPHVLFLAGFPTPQKTSSKRQIDTPPSEQSPDPKRPKVVADSVPKVPPASPALSSARTPQSHRSQQPVPPPAPQPPPTIVSTQSSSSAPPPQAATSVPASTPATAAPVPMPSSAPPLPFMKPEVLEQVVAPTGLKFGQMMERLKGLETEIQAMDAQMSNAQNTGQTAIFAALQKARFPKVKLREQIKMLLRSHYQKMFQAKDVPNTQAGVAESAPSNGSADAAPSTQYHPPNASSERPVGHTVEEQKPTATGAQMLTQFWQSRGGTLSAPSNGTPQAGPSQVQPHPAAASELAAQMQKLIDKKGIRPPTFGLPPQSSGTASHDTGGNPNPTNNPLVQTPNASAWQGTFSATFPKPGGQATSELQIHVVGILAPSAPSDIRMDAWPKNFALKPCKEPLKDKQELFSWLKRHQLRMHMMQFRANPHAPDGSVNEQKFRGLNKFMIESGTYAYVGWQMPSGKFSWNILIFPVNNNNFAGAMFIDGLPDLPGNGNTLNGPEEAKPHPLSGLNLPPEFVARMQSLEPAKQRLFLAQLVRAQQQEQLRRQQAQQLQQSTNPNQAPNPLGTSIPANAYRPVANIPPGLHANVNVPANAGLFNASGGTVNYEMMQSFMQRSTEGSTSQGMNPG